MRDVPSSDEKLPMGDLIDDEAVSLLADARRRRVIRHLHAADGPVTLSELAYTVASAITDTPKSKITMDTARRVQNSLYHVHIPKLEAMNVVDFDMDGKTIQATDNLAPLVSILDRL